MTIGEAEILTILREQALTKDEFSKLITKLCTCEQM